MRKSLTLLLLSAAVVLTFDSCRKFFRDSGNLVVEERALEDTYDRVSLEGSMDLYIVDDPSFDIRIEAGEHKLPHIETEVINHELVIRENHNHVIDDKQTKVFISNIVLESIDLHGSGDIEGTLVVDDFHLDIDGSGDVDLHLGDAELVDIDVMGSGDTRLEGTAEALNVRVEGSGDTNARYLIAEDVYIHVDGSGDTRVYVTNYLHVEIDGSGDVYYWGDPEEVFIDIDGSGEVEPQ